MDKMDVTVSFVSLDVMLVSANMAYNQLNVKSYTPFTCPTVAPQNMERCTLSKDSCWVNDLLLVSPS